MLTLVREQTADFITQFLTHQKSEISSWLEIPQKLEHGHLALPVFSLAKELRKAPPLIAKELAETMRAKKPVQMLSIEPLAGYVNFTFQDEYLQSILLQSAGSEQTQMGFAKTGLGKKLVIDYSSPNVAKPMHIGHLRATVIGQAIRNLAVTQGYEVTGVNHIGDWGVQFGRLAWAFREWGHEYAFAEKPFESLFELYVRFHAEAEVKPELEALGSKVFQQLEEGDQEIRKLWQKFVDISMQHYNTVYQLMGVQHDIVLGESFYNDKMKPVEMKLEQMGLLEQSEGAYVVRLSDEMPPCLIRKSDGASLYATRDLAAAIYRMETMKAAVNLYVVGDEQTLHFKQVFKVLEKMGYAWVTNCHHVSFGKYRFKDGEMSTRKGKVIFLEDVLHQAVERVKKVIAEKNPNLENKDQVARQVGVGAVIFGDLMSDRSRGVDFDWERLLDFEGDSGPYVQYCHVRCVSLIRKYARPLPSKFSIALKEPEERQLIRLLLNYQDVLRLSFDAYRPNVLAQYLLEVCRGFNHFYQKHRILGEATETAESRILLVSLTQRVLAEGLRVLSIQAPDVM